MDCINTEIIARENYEYLEKDQEPLTRGHHYSGSALNVYYQKQENVCFLLIVMSIIATDAILLPT